MLRIALALTLLAGPALAEADAPAASPPPAIRIAVQDLETSGVDPLVVKVVTDSLLVELRKLRGVSVIGMDEIRAMLDQEAAKAMVGCDDESCLADIAGALGAEVLVVGSMARVGDEHVLGLRRINQAEARVAGTVQRRLKAKDGEEFLAALGPAVAELFPERELRAGETRGVDEEVALKLNPPPLDPVWFYSTATLGIGLAAMSAALLTLNVAAAGYYRLVTLPSLHQGGSFAPVGLQQVGINSLLAASGITLLAALAVGGAAAAMTPFTDWEGYGDLDDEGASGGEP